MKTETKKVHSLITTVIKDSRYTVILYIYFYFSYISYGLFRDHFSLEPARKICLLFPKSSCMSPIFIFFKNVYNHIVFFPAINIFSVS